MEAAKFSETFVFYHITVRRQSSDNRHINAKMDLKERGFGQDSG